MPMDVRKSLKYEDDYYPICREERNIAAILYHALLLPGNLTKFLGLIGSEHSDNCEEASIYFEYAYLRDLWNKQADNDIKKNLILEALNPQNKCDLYAMKTPCFNKYFGASNPSENTIQSPSGWSIRCMDENINGDFFLDACKFKWAFNIKPDIVIHTGKTTAVCVEAKFESRESNYPSNGKDKETFQERQQKRGSVKQTEVQEYMFKELLGMKTDFVLLAKTKGSQSKTHRTLTWCEVFCNMDIDKCPKFVRDWVEHIKKECRSKKHKADVVP